MIWRMNQKSGKSLKIIWSDFSIKCLKDLSLYYTNVAGKHVSLKIRTKIFHATRHLARHPFSGQVEPLLENLDCEFRYCITGKFKIIYTIVPEGILITDVFDTRQNPSKLAE
jgi:toxin ParE1/3/4